VPASIAPRRPRSPGACRPRNGGRWRRAAAFAAHFRLFGLASAARRGVVIEHVPLSSVYCDGLRFMVDVHTAMLFRVG
jgi:hypothetical protein